MELKNSSRKIDFNLIRFILKRVHGTSEGRFKYKFLIYIYIYISNSQNLNKMSHFLPYIQKYVRYV